MSKTLKMGDFVISLDVNDKPHEIHSDNNIYKINTQTMHYDKLPFRDEFVHLLSCKTVEGYDFDGESSSFKSCGYLDLKCKIHCIRIEKKTLLSEGLIC